MNKREDIKRRLGIDQLRRPNELPPLTDFTIIRSVPPKPEQPAPLIPENDDDAAHD